MIKLLLIWVLMVSSSAPWLTDFKAAKEKAAVEHGFILLNFSGSDWCGPCIRLHKEIFDSEAFAAMAGSKLVLLNADFPRLKKNQLPKAQQEQNNKLADQYNTAGNFPSTMLLTADGKLLKEWDGYPKSGAVAFIEDIKQAMDAAR